MKPIATAFTASLLALALAMPAAAEQKTDFKIAWSIYVGWMPWGYAADHGIVQKWADKYGITIEVTQFNAGTVREIRVAPGRTVRAGDLIAVLGEA